MPELQTQQKLRKHKETTQARSQQKWQNLFELEINMRLYGNGKVNSKESAWVCGKKRGSDSELQSAGRTTLISRFDWGDTLFKPL